MRKNVCRGEEGYLEWHGQIANALDELDSLGGVLVTVSAGNDGREKPPGHTDEYMPNILSARHGSPLIITGAVNNRGQLAKLSSPGTGKVPITCYAVYVFVFVHSLRSIVHQYCVGVSSQRGSVTPSPPPTELLLAHISPCCF